MIELIHTQFYFLLSLPGTYIYYGAELYGYWVILYLAIWLVVGYYVSKLLLRRAHKIFFIAWLTLWFFPGTIICGSAAALPWIVVFMQLKALSVGGCSTLIGLAINFAINFSIVTVATVYLSRYKIVKA